MIHDGGDDDDRDGDSSAPAGADDAPPPDGSAMRARIRASVFLGCVAGFAGMGMALAWLLASGSAGPTAGAWLPDLGRRALPALAALAGWYIALIAPDRATQRAWRLLSGSALACLTGHVAWTVIEIAPGSALSGVAAGGTPWRLIADAGFLTALGLAMAGVLSFPRDRRRPLGRIPLGLDLAIAAIGVVLISHMLLLVRVQPPDVSRWEQILANTYVVGNVALVALVALVASRSPRAGARLPLLLLGSGFTAFALADTSMAFAPRSGLAELSVADTTWFFGYLLMGLAAVYFTRPDYQRTDGQPAGTTPSLPARLASLVTYAPIAAVLAVALYRLVARDGAAVDPLELGLALALIALLAARVRLLLLDNRRLTSSLDASAAHVAHQALHDPLTGLPNRALLFDRVHQALQRSARSGEPLAVIFGNLDGLRLINDRFGHETGDEVLRVLADRLQQSVRTCDTVARFGGDEFVVLCERLKQPDGIDVVLARLGEATHRPIPVGPHTFAMTFSTGVVVTNDCTVTADRIIDEADELMGRAKGRGRDQLEVVDWTLRLFSEAAAALDAKH